MFAKTRGKALLVIVGGLIGMSVGGIAWAAIPDSAGVIHGCYSKKSGALRVIDTAKTTSCASTELPLTWGQTGPAGPTGPTGPRGADGAQGIQGPPGPPLSSFDQLAGLLCHVNGVAGAIRVRYDLTTGVITQIACDTGVDTQTDVHNCGQIGNDVSGTPLPPHATSIACVNGQVAVGSCESGWYDVDGTFSDGCELTADQYEPNDTQATETNLGPGGFGGRTATIVPGDDIDWYRVELACPVNSVDVAISSLYYGVKFNVYVDGVLMNVNGPVGPSFGTPTGCAAGDPGILEIQVLGQGMTGYSVTVIER